MKHSALFFFFLLLQSASWAQDYLQPENSAYFDTQLDYRVTVGKVLGRELPYDLPKVIVLPSFHKEYIVGIAPEANGCAVVLGRADLLLWTYEVASSEPVRSRALLRDYPDDPLDVTVTVQRRSTTQTLCDRIASVWESALLQTRYSNSCSLDQSCTVVTDGVSYHFSTWVLGIGRITGKTQTPNAESPPWLLTSLVHTMRRFAEADVQIGARELEQALERVENVLE